MDPKILFTKVSNNKDKNIFYEFSKEHPNLSIYTLDVSSDKTDLNFREFLSPEGKKLGKIFNQKMIFNKKNYKFIKRRSYE